MGFACADVNNFSAKLPKNEMFYNSDRCPLAPNYFII